MIEHCQSPDCPYHTGGECWDNIRSDDKATVRELRALRVVYRNFALDGLTLDSGIWLIAVIQPITDRIKSLTQGSEI